MPYKYGVYGNIADSVAQSASTADTVAVYVGTAPVNLVRGYDKAGVVNAPVKVSDYLTAQKKLGLSKDWGKFTLCEAIEAHFNNTLGNIGDVFFINVLNPATHRKAEETKKELVFQNGAVKFLSDTIILDTLKIKIDDADSSSDDSDSGDATETKTYLTEGEDYTVDYDFTKGAVIISGADLTGTYTAEFYEIDTANIDETDIIGGVTAGGVYSGLGCVKLLYQNENRVVNLIGAPGWSHIPTVYRAMISAATKVNGHWEAFVAADIPTVDETDGVDTIDAAIKWKKEKAYNNERSVVCFPKAIDGDGRVFHISTLRIVEYMRTDATHDGVPFETAGNKQVDVIGQYFGKSSTNKGFDQETANNLTQNGICTVSFWGGVWNLWGDHTAAYAYGADSVDPRAIFDCTIRMLFHCVNGFQRRNGVKIDMPFTLRMKDQILDSEQEILDGYKEAGAFIGEPKILFLETDNSTSEMMNGNFQFRLPVTVTPPMHSATVNVNYTDEGFSSYFEEA